MLRGVIKYTGGIIDSSLYLAVFLAFTDHAEELHEV
jgi:hypothetical protein